MTDLEIHNTGDYEDDYWDDDFFRNHFSKSVIDKLIKGVSWYEGNKTASIAHYDYGSYSDICRLKNARDEEIDYVLKLYKREVGDDLTQRLETVSSAISSWYDAKKSISHYFCRYQFYPNSFTDWSSAGQVGSCLIMELVKNGVRLDADYLLKADKTIIENLIEQYVGLMRELESAKIGFGDLAHDNLLVESLKNASGASTNPRLKLVDYDDLYLPSMGKVMSDEAGKSGFRHRNRTKTRELTSSIHHFSSLVYYVTLLVCAKDKVNYSDILYRNIDSTQDLLFTGEDFENPQKSELFTRLRNHSDKEIKRFATILYDWSCKDSVKDMPSLPAIIDGRTFVPTTYTLRYNSNGGSGAMKSETIEYGSPHTLAKNKFTRNGYQFKGWATTKSGSEVYIDSAWTANPNSENNEIVTLYAVWEKIQKPIPSPKPRRVTKRNTRVPVLELLVSTLMVVLSAVILLAPAEYVLQKIVFSILLVPATICLYIFMSDNSDFDDWNDMISGTLILVPATIILWSIIILLMLLFPAISPIPFWIGIIISIGIALLIIVMLIRRSRAVSWDELG